MDKTISDTSVIVDVGNSRLKLALLQNDELGPAAFFDKCANVAEAAISWILNQSGTVKNVIIGSVATGHRELSELLLKHTSLQSCIVSSTAALPFTSRYASGQAGIDRLANVAAALELVDGSAIVVDAGSAITTEVISADKVFLGGAILPGLRLQSQALHRGTVNLPILNVQEISCAVGTDTASGIQSGLLYGTAGAVQNLIKQSIEQEQLGEPAILLTGGDAALLASTISMSRVAVVPQLTLKGIYLLARHQFPHAF